MSTGNTQVTDQINYPISIIFKLISLPILAVIQQDRIVITTRSHSNILDLIILIINLTIWISSECFDCVLGKLCIGMPAIVVETASKNSNIDYKMFLINNIILTIYRRGKIVVRPTSFMDILCYQHKWF